LNRIRVEFTSTSGKTKPARADLNRVGLRDALAQFGAGNPKWRAQCPSKTRAGFSKQAALTKEKTNDKLFTKLPQRRN
jgi:hypothetical protein